MLEGTYLGVPGVYRCAEEGCIIGRQAVTNDLLLGGARWDFIPSAATRSVADADYLVYGGWLKRPDSAVGTAISAGLGTGSDPFTVGNIAALTGKAKYRGKAAGFYAERYVDEDTAVSGSFTATAELEADFADTGAGTVKGMVHQFMKGDDTEAADWVVMLGSADILTGADGGFNLGDTSGSASGAAWKGEWGFQLFGNTADAPEAHPTGIAGTFGAQDGTPKQVVVEPTAAKPVVDAGFVGVIGGFGATKTTE